MNTTGKFGYFRRYRWSKDGATCTIQWPTPETTPLDEKEKRMTTPGNDGHVWVLIEEGQKLIEENGE